MQGTWALTQRSLRQDSRLLRFHLLRLGVVAALALAVFVMWDASHYSEAPGRDLLESLGWANFWAVTIAGVLLFAPTITEEKEDQTLGLLRMTGIGPASLLLGKALPKLVQLLLILIVQLPLVWLTITLGGVDWPLMINVYLVVFSQLIGVVALSLLASVMMRTSGGAVVMASALVFCWTVGILVVWDFLRHRIVAGSLLVPFRPSANLLAPLSPVLQLEMLLQSGATVSGTYLAVGASLVLAGLVSWLSVGSFNYWNQHESTQTELEWLDSKRFPVKDWIALLFRRRKPLAHSVPSLESDSSPVTQVMSLANSPAGGGRRASVRSWQNAIAWKDFFLLGGGRTGLKTRCLIAGLAVLGIVGLTWLRMFLNGTSGLDDPYYRALYADEPIMSSAAWAFGLDLLYLTVNLFAYEFRRQTWESLLLLPLPLGAICRRKILGAAVHLVPWVVAFLCGLAMVTTTEDLDYFWRDVIDDPLATLGIVLQVVTQFVTALIVLTWFSLRFNPWVAILLSGALYWAIWVGWIITLFMTFGFMSPPGPYSLQVLFHIGWIGGISLLGGGLLWSIRSKLRAEAASVQG